MFLCMQASAMATRLKSLQKLNPEISSVPSSVTKILIYLLWLLQETLTASSSQVFMSVPVTPSRRELFGGRSFSSSPMSWSIESGMHVIIALVSTLPLIVSGLRVWNMTWARTSLALKMSMERIIMSYDASYAPSFESVSDTSTPFWLLSLPFALFLSLHAFSTWPFLWQKFHFASLAGQSSREFFSPLHNWYRFSTSYDGGLDTALVGGLVFWFLLRFAAISMEIAWLGPERKRALTLLVSSRCFMVVFAASYGRSRSKQVLIVASLPLVVSLLLQIRYSVQQCDEPVDNKKVRSSQGNPPSGTRSMILL